ncbi:GGDEF domain-containing protein [Enterovirga sp. DB1703]|uniref:diguanylate cyclase n=1 Tax=Enterovirga aerilata TaxID=2730920 RepID=A0A849I9D4_9HYPH|nr:GGDEF domain-containing protein [Enterovirga sp. DB1703]
MNDTYGHDAGDRALVHVAKALSSKLGPAHHVSRFGGEEFLVVMRDVTATEAVASLRSVLASLQPLELAVDLPPVRCTFSAGVAGALPRDDLKGLLARADQALYDAKARGRGRIEIKRPTLTAACSATTGLPGMEATEAGRVCLRPGTDVRALWGYDPSCTWLARRK